jgi:hypothetical protein
MASKRCRVRNKARLKDLCDLTAEELYFLENQELTSSFTSPKDGRQRIDPNSELMRK